MHSRPTVLWTLIIALSVGSGLAFSLLDGVVAAATQRDDGKGKDAVEKLMKRVHKGKNSPYKTIEDTLFTKLPDWKLIDEKLPTLVEMSALLKTSSNMEIQDASEGYVAAVAELAPLVKDRSMLSARKAFDTLSKACADCHFPGGIGGNLD